MHTLDNLYNSCESSLTNVLHMGNQHMLPVTTVSCYTVLNLLHAAVRGQIYQSACSTADNQTTICLLLQCITLHMVQQSPDALTPATTFHSTSNIHLIQNQGTTCMEMQCRIYTNTVSISCINVTTVLYLSKQKPGNLFLNQERAGCRLAHAWFLKIDPVRIVDMRACVCVCVCVSAPVAINNQWHDVV